MIQIFFVIVFSIGMLASNLSFGMGKAKNVKLVISVDWEGDYLAPFNVSAIERFRQDHPKVKMVHFLNAAYFIKAGNRQERVKQEMLSALRPGDQLGLHIHGWKSLVEAAGVSFRNFPSFWFDYPDNDNNNDNNGNDDGFTDRGHDVFIDAYSVSELRKIIRFSLSTLAERGFTNLNIFRTGGWYLGPNVREAIAAEGIHMDSSAVPAELLAEEIGQKPLYQKLKSLWTGVNSLTLPFQISTSHGPIQELPNNTALADYVTSDDAFAVFKYIIENSDNDIVTLHYGFHHETADRFLPRVAGAIQKLEAYISSGGGSLDFVTLEGTTY